MSVTINWQNMIAWNSTQKTNIATTIERTRRCISEASRITNQMTTPNLEFFKWFGINSLGTSELRDAFELIKARVGNMNKLLCENNVIINLKGPHANGDNAVAQDAINHTNLAAARNYWQTNTNRLHKYMPIGVTMFDVGHPLRGRVRTLGTQTMSLLAQLGTVIDLHPPMQTMPISTVDSTISIGQTQIETILHEVSHLAGPTIDEIDPTTGGPVYGVAHAQLLATTNRVLSWNNAENYGFFVLYMGGEGR